jgi:hypothetical protein
MFGVEQFLQGLLVGLECDTKQLLPPMPVGHLRFQGQIPKLG